MQQEPTAPPPMPATTPSSPNRRRGAYISGAVLAVLIVGGLIIGLTPNHLGLSVQGSTTSATSSGTSDPQKTGCPSTAANVAWPHPATTTLHFADAGSDTMLHRGETVQIDLPATLYRWNVANTSNTTVTALAPAGYYDAASDMCVWRFTAQNTGTTLIQFLRRRNCAPGTICSDIQVQVPYTITVS